MCQSCNTQDKLNNVISTARSDKLSEIEKFCNGVQIHVLDTLSHVFNNPEFKVDWEDKNFVRTLQGIKVVLEVKKIEAENHLEGLRTLNEKIDDLDEESIPTVSMESKIEHIMDELEDWIETFDLSLSCQEEVNTLVDTLEKYSKVVKNNISKQ